MAIANLGGIAQATQEVTFVSTHWQVSHLFEVGNTFFRPMFEVAVTNIHQHAFNETGGGLGNLSVEARDDLYVALMPSLEISSELVLGSSENVLRPRARFGLTQYVGDTDPTVSATLVGTPDGVAAFGASAGMDDTLGFVELGFDLVMGDNLTIRMDGIGQFGENTEIYQGNLKVSIPF